MYFSKKRKQNFIHHPKQNKILLRKDNLYQLSPYILLYSKEDGKYKLVSLNE